MQQTRRKLRILKHISEISHSKLFLAEFIVCAAIVSQLIVPIRNNLCGNPSLLGDDTAKLIEDFKDKNKHQIPISSWMDRVYIINGSNYTKPFIDNPDMIEIAFFYYVCNIKSIIYSARQVAFRIFYEHPYFILASCKKKFGAKNLFLFFLASTLLCTIHTVGLIFFIELILEPFKDTLSWIDGRVYDASFALNIDRSSRLPHPFTMGLSAPFFLYTYHRYLMEDMVLTCEFVTYDENFIYKRTQWRKNGLPLKITNDRIFINVTINKKLDHEGLGEFYTVLSKLTIQLLQESDFGSYTCEYQNVPQFILIMPGPSMSQDFTQNSDKKSQPMSPDPECSCKPKEKNSEIGLPKSKSKTYVEKFQCFAEFIILKREERVLPKSINPGSIVISSAFYSTISGSDDVEFEISNQEDETETNCCSQLIKIYWYLFRGGVFFTEPLPFTRIIHDEKGLYFQHYQCMCKSSFGMQEFKIHRNYFNTTMGRKDMAEIIYPIKHKLLPEFTKPWSRKIKDDVQKFGHDHSSCFDSDLLSRGCAEYFNLFYSDFDDMFFIENIIIAVLIVILTIFLFFTYWVIRYKCIKPILAAFLYFNNHDTPFHCVNGIPLRNLRPCRRSRRNCPTLSNEDTPQFQIYLSYDAENEYDLMVAEHIKGKLLSMNVSAFDFQTDVLPGRLVLTEIENAIVNSSRFVVITSESYIEHKSIEFDAIQNTIVGQGSRLKDRLLIIKSEDCDIDRLYLVPCIPIPNDLRARDALDENIVGQFLKWEKSTKPHDETFQCNKSDTIVELLKKKEIFFALLIFICFVVIIAIWWVKIGRKQHRSQN